MTIHSTTRGADPISSTEREAVDRLRSRLNESLKIPDDLDTDLNLLRWIRGYQGDIERICTNFPQYVYSRNAAGFVGRDLSETREIQLSHGGNCTKGLHGVSARSSNNRVIHLCKAGERFHTSERKITVTGTTVLSLYIEEAEFNRIALGWKIFVLAKNTALSNTPAFFEMPHIKPFLPFIASSRLADTVWSDEHNAFMFVERAWCQPREFIKTFKASDYLLHCFGYSELLLQLILERERKQPKDRGPVQFIVIFDLATVNITDYVNPMSGYMRLWQLRSDLWQEWYPEVVQRIYLVNSPRLVSLLWKIARLFLTEQNLRRMEIVGDKEMTKHINSKFVPKEFGGDFVNKDMPGDESGVSVRRKITSADFYQSYHHYAQRGVQRPKPAKKDLMPGEYFTIPIIVPEGKSLLWDFTASGEIEFFICKDKDESQLMYPRLRLVTTKLPEEGVLADLDAGEYSFVFANHGSFFTTKLEYAIAIV